jgi:hypothetical protein
MDEYTETLLTTVQARRSDDSVKTDLELICTQCPDDARPLCDIEHDDTLSVLVAVALHHARTEH